MPLRFSDLQPYKSFVLARMREGRSVSSVVASILDDIAALFQLSGSGGRRLVTRGDPETAGELRVGFLHYIEEQKVTWAADHAALSDRLNHLALVCRRHRHVALYFSDAGWHPAVLRRLRREADGGFGALEPIPRGILNAAFVTGEARTLWLSGTHARTSVKADSKILSGIDLRDALDPLGDQSYAFTAARAVSMLDNRRTPVGVSPGRGGVWLGTTKDWTEFVRTTTALLRHVESVTKPEEAPLPVLAVPAGDASALGSPFDLAILPPELLSDDPSVDPDHRRELELWAERASFRVIDVSGTGLTAEISVDGDLLGTVELTIDAGDPERVRLTANGEPARGETRELHARALQACRKPQWVKVWYESGHTLSDGRLYAVRHRDLPFLGFAWVDFDGFDAGREKPEPLSEVGRQDSLFCWVQGNWPLPTAGTRRRGRGWLACDDGAMEIADFLHLDLDGDVPVLTLLHVKSAGKTTGGEGISVSCFEQVVSQAVKNLRFLDRLSAEEGLSAGFKKRVGRLVWRNGAIADRRGMIKALRAIGTSYSRRVVIVQPRLTKRQHDVARAKPAGIEAARLRQLDTLLLGARANCLALNAELLVIGSAERGTGARSKNAGQSRRLRRR